MTTTTTEPVSAATGTIAYHWIVTPQGRVDGDPATSTVSGSANLASGFLRDAAFRSVVKEAQRMTGFADPVAILFFSLERAEL